MIGYWFVGLLELNLQSVRAFHRPRSLWPCKDYGVPAGLLLQTDSPLDGERHSELNGFGFGSQTEF